MTFDIVIVMIVTIVIVIIFKIVIDNTIVTDTIVIAIDITPPLVAWLFASLLLLYRQVRVSTTSSSSIQHRRTVHSGRLYPEIC